MFHSFYKKRNVILFQGEKALLNHKQYFEGWYFKNMNDNFGISFIPGINITPQSKKAFIQIITKDTSSFVSYPIEKFIYHEKPFSIQIEHNLFTKDYMHICIEDSSQNLHIHGKMDYSNHTDIKNNIFYPNIMGPFSYLPFMECNHAILSMKSQVNGNLNINEKKFLFSNDTGYIEKDWGYSFPKKYIWCQGNEFQNPHASFLLSIADVPLKLFTFQGFICILKLKDKEYKFTSYNASKLELYEVGKTSVHVVLKKGDYSLTISSDLNTLNHSLMAPVQGMMKRTVFENITSSLYLTLKKKDQILFQDHSKNSGLEIG